LLTVEAVYAPGKETNEVGKAVPLPVTETWMQLFHDSTSEDVGIAVGVYSPRINLSAGVGVSCIKDGRSEVEVVVRPLSNVPTRLEINDLVG
jgi:hypothetical protein